MRLWFIWIPGLTILHMVVCDQKREHRLKIVSDRRKNPDVLHINFPTAFVG